MNPRPDHILLHSIRANPTLSDRQLARMLGCSRQKICAARKTLDTYSSAPATNASRTSWAGTWKEWISVAAIFGFALLLRCIHYFDIKANDPYFSNLTVDPKAYHEWAIRISDGDWLGNGTFHLSPLYPYMLGATYAIFGRGFDVGHILNVVLGIISVALIWMLARMVFGWREGLVAATFAAIYPMLIYTGSDLVLENVQIPSNALMLILLCAAVMRPRLWLLGLAGIMLGISGLARANVLLFVPLALVCIAIAPVDGKRWRTICMRCAVFCLGLIVSIAPVTARNWIVADDFVLVTDNGGINFYVGNNEDASGYFNPPKWIPKTQFASPDKMRAFATNYAQEIVGHDLKPSGVSRFWSTMAWTWMAENPSKATILFAKKFKLMLSSNEFGVERQLLLDREYSSILQLPLPGFAVVVPLAMIGMGLTIRRWRQFAVINAFVLSQGLALVIMFISDRYRLPMMSAIFALAGFALVWAWDAAQTRHWRALIFTGCTAALLVLATSLAGGATISESNYFNLGNKLRDQGRIDEAIIQFRKAIALSPGDIVAHNNLALLLERRFESRGEAVTEWETVRQLSKAISDDARIERAERHLKSLRQSRTDIDFATPPDSSR